MSTHPPDTQSIHIQRSFFCTALRGCGSEASDEQVHGRLGPAPGISPAACLLRKSRLRAANNIAESSYVCDKNHLLGSFEYAAADTRVVDYIQPVDGRAYL